MRFDIITIFPKIFDSYLNESMMKRARAKKLVDIHVHNLRDFVKVAPRQVRGNLPPRRQVDDRPYGGGPGMVMKLEPLVRAVSSLKFKVKSEKLKVILFSASGKQFTQKMARDFAKKYERLILIAGHYEGIDERIFKVLRATSYKLQAISVGPYVLTGGELPAMVVIDSVARHIQGFLGKGESLEEKRHGIGVPVYTRPEVFGWRGKKYRAPKILLSGEHKKIAAWRETRRPASLKRKRGERVSPQGAGGVAIQT